MLLLAVITEEQKKDGAESGEKDAEEGVFDVAMTPRAQHALYGVDVAVVRRVHRQHVHRRRAVRMLNADVSVSNGGWEEGTVG